MKLQILLSSYNGKDFLREQLDSLCAQTIGDIGILVRDDGSIDETLSILDNYTALKNFRLIKGNNIGPARSFWYLLRCCDDAEFYAFCDQDDVWDPDKLEIAVRALETHDSSTPVLYCSDVRVTNIDGNIIHEHMVRREPADFQHALIRNLAPGCTYVFNRAAKELLCRFDAEKTRILIHDWMVYQIISCTGKVIFDNIPHMNYRQHNHNVIGIDNKSVAGLIRKVQRFWNGSMRNSRSKHALYLEMIYGDLMSPNNRYLTELFAHYREDKEKKKELLINKYVNLKIEDRIAFKLLVAINRL